MDYRILTYGKLSTEFAEQVTKQFPALKVVVAWSRSDIKSLLPSVNAVAGFNFLKDEDASHIEWVHSFGAGVDSFLELKSLGEDTIFTRTTGQLGVKIGEFCLAYILADLRAVFAIYENQKARNWEQLPTQNLYDKTVLVLGTGSIGSGIASKLRGLCKKLIGLNTSNSSNELFDLICDWSSYKRLASNVDVVISALPSTGATNSILNTVFLSHFQGILLMNVGRGNVLDDSTLLQGLSQGFVRKAILDVFSEEPLPSSSPLWSHEQVLISPHQSGITSVEEVLESFDRAYEAVTEGEKNELFVDAKRGY